MGTPRTTAALLAAAGLVVGCAAAEDSTLSAGKGGDATGGAGAGGTGAGGTGGGQSGGGQSGGGGVGPAPGLRLVFSAGAGDLVPGTRLDAWVEKDGLRLEEGVTWTLTPASGLGDRMGRVATGIGLGGCAACVRLGGVGLTGPSLPGNDFARFSLEGLVGGERLAGEVRLHAVQAASTTPDGRAIAASTGLDGGKLGDRGLEGHGTLFFAAGAEVDPDGFAPLQESLFVAHEGTLTRLEERGASGGSIVALGLVDGGSAVVAVRSKDGVLLGVAQSASTLGVEKIEAASPIVAGACGEFVAVVAGGKAYTIDPELGAATEAHVGGLTEGSVARRIFSGEGRDSPVLAFVLADDGAIHPFGSSSVCAEELATDSGHNCLGAYTNRTSGPLEDAVHVAGHLYGRGTDRASYLGQGTEVCTETAAGRLDRADCRDAPGPLAAGLSWAWEANGACGFSGLQLEAGAVALSVVPACVVCGFGMNEAGEPKGGAPLDVRAVRSLVDGEGNERLVLLGAPEQGLRVVVREPKGDCPVTCP